jgi:hypothetical protein
MVQTGGFERRRNVWKEVDSVLKLLDTFHGDFTTYN